MLIDCQSVIVSDPLNEKALFRKAKSLAYFYYEDQAMKILE